jgi:nicotinate-nucleotide--dimethylbenzimidazole phosphoribosyltransferase
LTHEPGHGRGASADVDPPFARAGGRCRTADLDPRLAQLIGRCRPADADAVVEARNRSDLLAKPPGSLGQLEALAARLAGIAGCCPPPVPRTPVVVVAAGDHGVHRRQVSDWPQEITGAMFRTVAAGDATINAIAATVGARIVLVDAGLVDGDLANNLRARRQDLRPLPGSTAVQIVDARLGSGTRDLAVTDAMTVDDCLAGIAHGARIVSELVAEGADLIALGDLGIANTTASAALIAALTGLPAAQVTGNGASVDPTRLAGKVRVVDQAVRRFRSTLADDHDPADRPVPAPSTALRAAAALGGFEHAVLVGVLLQATAERVPVVLDGVISAAAVLVAVTMAPAVRDHVVAGHRSVEPGVGPVLERLEQAPLLDLGMRLGEGTGAALAIPSVVAAARVLAEVATIDEVRAGG